jgi:hypothetical protein
VALRRALLSRQGKGDVFAEMDRRMIAIAGDDNAVSYIASGFDRTIIHSPSYPGFGGSGRILGYREESAKLIEKYFRRRFATRLSSPQILRITYGLK